MMKLGYEELLRLEPLLLKPFRGLLGGPLRLLPPVEGLEEPQVEGAVVRVPLVEDGVCVGMVEGRGQVGPEGLTALTALAEAGVEMVRLRLASERDELTGLLSPPALERVVREALSRLRLHSPRGRSLGEVGVPSQVGVVTVVIQGLGDLEESDWSKSLEVMGAIGRAVKGLGGLKAAGWMGEGVVGVVEGARGVVEEVGQRMVQALERVLREGGVDGGVWAGAAVRGAPGRGELPGVLARGLIRRARVAAEAAGGAGEGGVVFYEEVVERAGRVVEVMGMGRVRLGVGRAHGLGVGERVALLEGGRVAGVVEVVEAGDRWAEGEIVELAEGGVRVGQGLRRLGRARGADSPREVVVGGRRLVVEHLPGSSLVSLRGLNRVVEQLVEEGLKLVGMMLEMEGLERVEASCGEQAARAVMEAVAEVGRRHMGPRGVWGVVDGRRLGVVLAGIEVEEALERAQVMLGELKAQGQSPVRAGLSYHPLEGFPGEGLLERAGKALVHAGFLKPFTAVVFDALSLNISGDRLFDQGLVSEAIAEYMAALKLNPAEANVLNSLGVCYGSLGQLEEALKWFHAAAEAAPDDYMAYYNLGHACRVLGRLQEAERWLARARELAPNEPQVALQQGLVAWAMGRLAQAAETLGQAAAMDGCPQVVHRYLGQVLVAMGRSQEAEAAFTRALKANPDDHEALAALGGLYITRGANLEVAASLLRRATQLEPGELRYWQLLVKALVAMGDHTQAMAVVERALAVHPQAREVLLEAEEKGEATAVHRGHGP